MSNIKSAVVVAARRSAVGKAPRGALKDVRPDELGAQILRATLETLPNLDPALIDDLMVGCAMPEAEQGLNVARMIGLDAGLPHESSAITVNRFCSSGLQTIATACERIMVGAIDCAVAGGVESMSMVPMGGHVTRLHPRYVEERPEVYISMGLTAENVARKFEVSREDQDAFAFESHQRAVRAIAEGRFKDEIIPITRGDGSTFEIDEGPRADTSLEALAKLRAVFHAKGTVTAGNSSQTSDGAAMAVVMSEEKAAEAGLQPLARFVGFAVAGVPPEIMGIGPIEAIPKVLRQTGLSLADMGVIELNEAFASQSIAITRTLELDPANVNPNGGAIALGHPLGCTGAKLTASAIAEMHRRQCQYGMVTMCIGGGMGAAGIFERM